MCDHRIIRLNIIIDNLKDLIRRHLNLQECKLNKLNSFIYFHNCWIIVSDWFFYFPFILKVFYEGCGNIIKMLFANSTKFIHTIKFEIPKMKMKCWKIINLESSEQDLVSDIPEFEFNIRRWTH